MILFTFAGEGTRPTLSSSNPRPKGAPPKEQHQYRSSRIDRVTAWAGIQTVVGIPPAADIFVLSSASRIFVVDVHEGTTNGEQT